MHDWIESVHGAPWNTHTRCFFISIYLFIRSYSTKQKNVLELDEHIHIDKSHWNIVLGIFLLLIIKIIGMQ